MTKTKARRQRKLAAESAAIERQLKNAVAVNPDGPVLGRSNISYELAERTRRGTAHGGMGMIAKLVERVGLAGEIDSSLHLLKLHKPYHESDHVLNIAYNALCGGRTTRFQTLLQTRCVQRPVRRADPR